MTFSFLTPLNALRVSTPHANEEQEIIDLPYLDDGKDYSVIVEFYTECDSVTQVVVETGGNVDTVEVPANSFSWYETDVASATDTLLVKIKRISSAGFVPVSRVIVWRPNEAESYLLMCGPQGNGPEELRFCLYQPCPNPFSDAATIRYSLPYATHVSLKVYDITGRLVSRLVDEDVPPGVHTLCWEGRDKINRRCASGVYFVRLEADKYTASKKIVLLK